MVSRIGLIAASCMVVAICGGLVWRFDTKHLSQQNTERVTQQKEAPLWADTQWIPDDITRARAQKLTAQDVNFIRLKGLHMGYDRDPSQDITDPKMIEVFLNALRNAEMKKPGPVAETAESNRCDTFEIFLKSHDVWLTPTIFGVWEYNYGRPFQEALVALGKYRADQLRTLLRERKPHLKKVTVESPLGCSVPMEVFRTPKQQKAIIAELNVLDENAFAYAKTDRLMVVELFFDDGKEQNVYLALRNWKYHKPDEKPKAWPPIIGAYLKRIETECYH